MRGKNLYIRALYQKAIVAVVRFSDFRYISSNLYGSQLKPREIAGGASAVEEANAKGRRERVGGGGCGLQLRHANIALTMPRWIGGRGRAIASGSRTHTALQCIISDDTHREGAPLAYQATTATWMEHPRQ